MSDSDPHVVPSSIVAGADSGLKWRVRKGDKRPDLVVIVISAALVAGLIGLKFVGHPLFAVLGFAMILASTTEVWWGTRYEIDATGAKATTGVSTTSILWADVKRVLPSETEVTLSPLPADSKLAPFRGVTLRYGSLSAETVAAAINRFGGDHVRNLG